MDKFITFITAPLFGLFLALLFGALAMSGRFSVAAANWLLAASWAVGALSISKSGLIKDVKLIWAANLSLGVFCLLLSWWMSPAPVRPANSKGFQDATDTVRVSIGEGGTGYAGAEVPLDALRLGPFHPFKWSDYEPITLQMKNDRVLFNFVLWDSSGKPPIEVHDNEFTVRNPQWDKNRSDNELEVINSEGTVVFQMIRKSPTDILLTGIFPLPGGTFLIAGHNGAIQTNQILPKYLPGKIFKYPSWQYPGVHADEP